MDGIGVISVVSNILPKEIHDIVYEFKIDYQQSIKNQLKYFPLIKSLFIEVNPIPIKYVLNRLGYNVGIPRLPLIELSEKNKLLLDEELKKVNMIP